MTYIATINTPGYLPENDDPPVFDSQAEAWDYLYQERRRLMDEADVIGEPEDPYDGDECLREINAKESVAMNGFDTTGTVYGGTPGYDGDHDLGLAYSVSVVEEEQTKPYVTIGQLIDYLQQFDPTHLVITDEDDLPSTPMEVEYIDLTAALIALRDGQESGPS